MLSITDMQYLVALAEDTHFGRAAARCNVSQPALSAAIAKLESQLGFLLFERLNRGVMITPEGKALADEAAKVLKQVGRIQELVEADKDQLLSSLNLGSDPSLGSYLLPQILVQFQHQNSQRQIHLHEADPAVLKQQLLDGSLDAILLADNQPIKDCVLRELNSEPWQLLLPLGHSLSSSSRISIKDLRSVSLWVTQSDWHLLPQWIKNEVDVQTVNSYSLLRGLISTHQIVGLMPFIAANSQIYASQKWVTIPLADIPVRPICLAWRTSYPRYKMMELLSQAIKASAEWQLNFVAPEQHQMLGLDFFHR
jgi:LysR family transcriptional regulator, hydrogen peroxide-inducible genes activator